MRRIPRGISLAVAAGERKMVSIARALALDPKLLLLDEPFEGLSPAIIPSIASTRGDHLPRQARGDLSSRVTKVITGGA